MIQEMMTIGVIRASNSTPDGAGAENPPAGMTGESRKSLEDSFQNSKLEPTESQKKRNE